MATHLDALSWREIYGRTLRRPEQGRAHAYVVAPLYDNMTYHERDTVVENTRRSMIGMLDHGDVHYVTAEMTAVLQDIVREHMAHRELFHIDEGDLPSSRGFVYFDGSVKLPTEYGFNHEQELVAVGWAPLLVPPEHFESRVGRRLLDSDEKDQIGNVVIGTMLVTFVETPPRPRGNFEDYGKWKPRMWIPCPWGVRTDPTMVNWKGEIDHVDVSTPVGPTDLDPGEKISYEDSVEASRRVMRLMLAWMAFIQTEIPVLHQRPESYDRVMHKEGRPPADVKVTLLRRYESTPAKGMAEVDWQYQWKVKEHYRWQRVGPNRAFVRRVKVRSYWKGPEDKPRIERDEITVLGR